MSDRVKWGFFGKKNNEEWLNLLGIKYDKDILI